MELQSALLLLGLVIVGAVGLSAYDSARFRRGVPKPRGDDSMTTDAFSAAQADLYTVSQLDVHPARPADTTGKIISPDSTLAAAASSRPVDTFYQELADIEHVAVMPLALGVAAHDFTSADTVAQALPDSAIDFIVNLPGAGPVERDFALAIYKQSEYLLEKPRAIYGLRHSAGVWTNLVRDREGARYSDLSVAIQLLDHHGPIGESELNTFSQMCLKLADQLQRPTKFALTFEQGMERARELHKFCETYDVFANINLVPNGDTGFNGRLVESAALRVGMDFGAMNIFHLKNKHSHGSRHLFSMANLFHPGEFNLAKLDTTKIQGLTLFMSVPGAHQPVKVFERMNDTARRLCELLGAKMLDHDRRPLTDQGLQVIRAQIERLSGEMQGFGVIPGSATALRLFFDD